MGDVNNTTDVYGLSNFDYTNYNRVFQSYGYFSAILYPSGIILNLLSLIILFKIKMQETATGIHLLGIGITDVICMIMGITYSFPLQELLGIKPTDFISKVFCRVNMTISYPAVRAGALMIVSATCERFLSVAFPLHVKSWPMLTASKIIVGIISLIGFSETVMWIILYTDDMCWSSPFDNSFKRIYRLSYSILWFITAGLVLVFSSLIILFLSAHTNQSTNTMKKGKQTRITVMLFTIAVTFLLSTISELINFIVSEHFIEESQKTVDLWTVTWALLFLYDFYHWSNFVIYFIFLQNFRTAFLSIFCTTCRDRVRVDNGMGGSSSRSATTSLG